MRRTHESISKDIFHASFFRGAGGRMDRKNVHENLNLKGTLMSVFVVGFVIVSMWTSVYFLYLTR